MVDGTVQDPGQLGTRWVWAGPELQACPQEVAGGAHTGDSGMWTEDVTMTTRKGTPDGGRIWEPLGHSRKVMAVVPRRNDYLGKTTLDGRQRVQQKWSLQPLTERVDTADPEREETGERERHPNLRKRVRRRDAMGSE